MFSKIFMKITEKKPIEKVSTISNDKPKQIKSKITPTRIGDLGEYKINIQLDQLPKNSKYLSDLFIPNVYAKSGYSQIDQVIFTPYAIFVIETKNYAGTIYGERSRSKWSVNGKFPMMNPFNQNYGHIQAVQSVLTDVESASFISMVSFTKRCTFKVNEELRKIQSNDLIVYDTELSEFISRKISVIKFQNPESILSNEKIQDLYNKLRTANITDLHIREMHVEKLKNKDSEEIVKKEKPLSTCKVCGKVVSEKVKSYCLSNKIRFNGYIYCFEHQEPCQ